MEIRAFARPAAMLLACLLATMLLFVVAAKPSEAASQCRSIGGPINYADASGILATFSVSQTGCWDGVRLTYVSAPRVTASVTERGASRGWRYGGLTQRRDSYFEYEGRLQGGHVSVRQGAFKICGPDGACSQAKAPKIKLYFFYDRGGYQVKTP